MLVRLETFGPYYVCVFSVLSLWYTGMWRRIFWYYKTTREHHTHFRTSLPGCVTLYPYSWIPRLAEDHVSILVTPYHNTWRSAASSRNEFPKRNWLVILAGIFTDPERLPKLKKLHFYPPNDSFFLVHFNNLNFTTTRHLYHKVSYYILHGIWNTRPNGACA